MNPTTSIRTAVKDRLVALLSQELTAVQVSYAWPGKDFQNECVYLGASRGNVTIPVYMAGRKTRDDTFTILVHCYAGRPGQATSQEADQRAEELYAALENVLANNPKLDDMPGVHWAAQNGQADFAEPEPTDEGWVAAVVAEVTVKTRLS